MAPLELVIVCVGILLLGRQTKQTMALSVIEWDKDRCDGIKCPDIPDTPLCPDDSSFRSDEENDRSDDADYQYQLQPLASVQLEQSRGKRDLYSSYVDMLELCCREKRCSCNKCPAKPKCERGAVILELSQGNEEPGNCCSKYKCGKVPACNGTGTVYWQDSCIKCHSCRQLCTKECEQEDLSPPGNCLSDDKQLKLNGMSWTQGDGCEKCNCKDGYKHCVTSYCKKPECKDYIKLPDVCCPICPEPAVTPEPSTRAPTTRGTASSISEPIPEMPIIQQEPASISENATAAEKPLEPLVTDMPTSTTISSSSSSSSSTLKDVPEDSNEFTELPKMNEDNNEVDFTEISSTSDTSVLPQASTESTHGTSTDSNSTENDFEDNTTTYTTDNPEELDKPENNAEQPELDDNTTEETVDSIEYTTLRDMDNTEIDSSSSVISSSTTEHPNSLATAAPAAQMPESTSWHRDSTIDDADYRFANENHNEKNYMDLPIYEEILWLWVIIPVVFFVVVAIAAYCLCRRKERKERKERKQLKQLKSLYSSVPSSDSNISENTNISDVVIHNEKPFQQKKPQKLQSEPLE